MAAEAIFWSYVEQDKAPTPDGEEATSDAIQTIYAEDNGGSVDLFGREALLEERKALKAQVDVLDKRISKIENIIKEDMGNCEKGTVGAWTVSWKTQTRSTFQAKEFAKANPDIDLAPYYRVTTSRPFKINEKD